MAYLLLKFLHTIGATVILGTGAGIAFFVVMAHRTGEARVVADTLKSVIIADFIFTATAVCLQPVTGAILMAMLGYNLADGWIALSLILYAVAGLFWLPVIWMQMRMRTLAREAAGNGMALPAAYHRLYRLWFTCGVPAFAAVLVIYWLMTFKPAVW